MTSRNFKFVWEKLSILCMKHYFTTCCQLIS